MAKVHIAMDYRESGFKTLFSSYPVSLNILKLEVGDFICSEHTVVERKTREDFENSILDRRLFLQLENLKNNFENVIFIIEGEESFGRISREALMGAYAFLATKNSAIFFTRNKESTAELIYHIAKHEQLSERRPLSIKGKRKTFTLSQTQRSILESFPLLGPKLAQSLLMHFGSLEQVFKAKESELISVEKIGKKKAKIFRKTLENSYNPDEDPL